MVAVRKPRVFHEVAESVKEFFARGGRKQDSDIEAKGQLLRANGKHGGSHEARTQYFSDLLDQTGGRGRRA